MKNFNRLLFALPVMVLLMASCHGRPEPIEAFLGPHVIKQYLYNDQGVVTDSVFYEYNTPERWGHVIKLTIKNSSNAYINFDYDQNKIVKKHYFNSLTNPVETAYDEITYHGDTLNSITHFVKNTSGFEIERIATFFYNAQHQLQKLTIVRMAGGNKVSSELQSISYTGNSNNITGLQIFDTTNGTPYLKYSFAYTYGFSFGYFRGMWNSLLPLLTDASLNFWENNSAIANSFSEQNLISITRDNTTLPVTYTFSNQNLEQIRVNNIPAVSYIFAE